MQIKKEKYCTSGADVVERRRHVRVAVGSRVVDRRNQRNLAPTRQELQKRIDKEKQITIRKSNNVNK